MTALFDDNWLDMARKVLGDLPVEGDVTASIQYTITGLAEGKLVLGLTVADGRFVSLDVGRVSKPSCKISLSVETAEQILDGSLDVDVAYMRGALKVEGDHALWLVAMRSWRQAARSALVDASG